MTTETAASRCCEKSHRRTRMEFLRLLWSDESGQDLTEYALLIVLVALGSVAAMNNLAIDISLAFSKAGSNLTT
jgi:pilus assembly protein Flp/PilA